MHKNSPKKGIRAMKKLFVVVLISILTVGVAVAYAAEKGTAKEAIAMVDKGVAYINANGKEKAFAAFNNPKGEFVKGDLYIYVLDLQGVCLAHGANVKHVGKLFLNIPDPDGKMFFREIVELAKTKGSGWVDYKWTNPISKKIEAKTTYCKKVKDVVVACGVYK